MEFEKITLHHSPGTRSARVLWVLHEIFGETLDPRVEIRKVDLYAGEQRRPPFAALNPNRAVPVLEIAYPGGQALTMVESGAMVEYLADAFPVAGLAPAPGPSPARADYLQAAHYLSGWMDAHLWMLFQQAQLLPEPERDPKTVARIRAKFAEEIEPFLRRRLEAGPYICGEAFTAADCLMGHNAPWARMLGFCQEALFKDYVKRVTARPAYAAAFADAKK